MMLAKLDLENAYQIVPVHPDDQWLLGMEWEGGWYVDTKAYVQPQRYFVR